ncbi:MAG: sigma-70 family RNA polymerase sigma factor [Oscillospiraceae bacterium]
MNTHERREKVAQMSKSIFQYCLSRTSSYQESEDLSQEILLTLCESIEDLRDEKAFFAFVWRTADNILKGWYRDKVKNNNAELDDDLADDSWERLAEQSQENEQLALIIRELALLNSNYRRVMAAYYIDGLSVKDISARFSLTQSMVKYLLFQSRKRIKEGITMERNFGQLSCRPVELISRSWGRFNVFHDMFRSRIKQNIMMACYYEKQTEEQICLQTGVPTAYLENEISQLLEHELLLEKNGYYRSNAVIVTQKMMNEIYEAHKDSIHETAEFMRSFIDSSIDEVRAVGFYGSDMPLNSMKWFLVSQLLHLAYIDLFQEKLTFGDWDSYPEDKFGQKGYRWLSEKSGHHDIFMFRTSRRDDSEKADIVMWDVDVNGDPVCMKMNRMHETMLIALLTEQPSSESDKLICAELMDNNFAVRTDTGIKPNFPCLTKEQTSELYDLIVPVAQEICSRALAGLDGIRRIMAEHTPEHLLEYAEKVAPGEILSEASDVMRELCESGWLVPLTKGMLASTVMYEHSDS